MDDAGSLDALDNERYVLVFEMVKPLEPFLKFSEGIADQATRSTKVTVEFFLSGGEALGSGEWGHQPLKGGIGVAA